MTRSSQILMEESTCRNYQLDKEENEPRILFSLIGKHPIHFREKLTGTNFGIKIYKITFWIEAITTNVTISHE